MGRRNKVKKYLLILAAILTIGGGTGVIIANQDQPTPVVQQVQKQEGITYQGVEGKNALELLKSKYTVETEVYTGVGEMVTSIDGEKPASNQFWGFYINDKPSQVGADSYVTKESDTLSWKLDTIE